MKLARPKKSRSPVGLDIGARRVKAVQQVKSGVQVTRALTPQLQLAAGYAHIFTGDFLKQATPGASYSHPYVMATYVFLAER